MYNKIRNLSKNKVLLNGTLFSLFSFINRGFSFLLLLILANYILPKDYGYLSLFVTVSMVVGFFIALSTDGYLSVAYFKEGNNGVRQSVSSVFVISLVTSLLLFCVVFLFGTELSVILELPLNVLYLVVSISFFTVFSNMILDYFRLREQVLLYGFFSCSNALLNFLLSIALVKYFSYGWQGRIYAQLICCVLCGTIGLIFFWRHNLIVLPQKSFLKKIIVWGIPIIPHLATNFVRQGCDRYIINYFHSLDDVGLFSFALNIANIIVMIGLGFNQSFSVDIYKVLGNSSLNSSCKTKTLSNQKKHVCFIYSVCSSVIAFCGYFFIPYFLPKYSCSRNYFLLLSIWAYLQCLYFLYTNFLFYFNKTRWIMYITFGSSIIHLVLSLLLTRYSLYYSCLVYIVSQSIILLLVRYVSLKTLKKKL